MRTTVILAVLIGAVVGIFTPVGIITAIGVMIMGAGLGRAVAVVQGPRALEGKR